MSEVQTWYQLNLDQIIQRQDYNTLVLYCREFCQFDPFKIEGEKP